MAGHFIYFRAMSYCSYTKGIPDKNNVHVRYHDHAYGFPITTDDELFCRLVLEINQAGLSWNTILVKEENFRKAYRQFSISKVANFSEKDVERLMQDAGIIRNRLKIQAAIYNAGIIRTLQKSHGSFLAWLDAHHPMEKAEWVKLFKKTFRFTGGEIVGEFLMSTGYLPGAHDTDCPVHAQVLRSKPAWTRKIKK